MGATANGLPKLVTVEPGTPASVLVQLRNTGGVVDEYSFEVLGDAAAYAKVEPETLTLYPGSESELRVVIDVPRSPSAVAGRVPVGLRIASKEHPDSSFVEEGELEIAAFVETAAELLPRTSHGRLSGRHELAFDNRGNAIAHAMLDAADPEEALAFTFKPPALVAAPATAVFSKVRIQPRKRFLRGSPKTHTFELYVETEGEAPRTVSGMYVQEALLPKWLVPALVGLAALAALWAFVLQPQIKSTARDAVAAPLANQKKQTDDALKKAGAAQATGSAAKKAADNAATTATGAESTATGAKSSADNANKTANTLIRQNKKTPVPVVPPAAPKNFRLAVSCAQQCEASYTAPDGQSFQVRDIILENPRGDTGTITLTHNGQTVLAQALENFRDLDFHFIAPIVIGSGEKFGLAITCANAPTASASAGGLTAASGPCSDAAYVGGFQKKSQPAQKQ